jgi:hypothetical protein
MGRGGGNLPVRWRLYGFAAAIRRVLIIRPGGRVRRYWPRRALIDASGIFRTRDYQLRVTTVCRTDFRLLPKVSRERVMTC